MSHFNKEKSDSGNQLAHSYFAHDVKKTVPKITPETEQIIKPTVKRYVILLLFCLNSANKGFQWIAISAISTKITYFYGVSNYIINSTSVLFLLSFLLLSWPACNLVERWGQRKAVLLAALGGALGGLIKCFCCNDRPEGIYLLFLGQEIVSLGEQLIFSVPNRLASVWFPDHQVSSAVAISVLGAQMGVALGFLLPQLALDGCETREEIGLGLWHFVVANTVFSSVLFLACVWLFDEEPKYPPGEARLKQLQAEHGREESACQTYLQDMSRTGREFLALMKNRDFNLLTIGYGINIGLSATIPTLLDQQLTVGYPDDDASLIVGRIGFLYELFGALGTPICGLILDKTRRYLWTNRALTLISIISICAYSYSMSVLRSPVLLCLSASLLGASQSSIYVSGLEMAVELTYPASELATATLMNFWPTLWGIGFIFLGSHIIDTYGALAANAFYLICLLGSLILLLNIRETLKRQQAAQVKS